MLVSSQPLSLNITKLAQRSGLAVTSGPKRQVPCVCMCVRETETLGIFRSSAVGLLASTMVMAIMNQGGGQQV